MKDEISVFIDKPCNQQWGTMKDVEGGKFCEHCNKVVIDFTNFTNEELQLFFRFNAEKICGKLKASQTYSDKKVMPQWNENNSKTYFGEVGTSRNYYQKTKPNNNTFSIEEDC